MRNISCSPWEPMRWSICFNLNPACRYRTFLFHVGYRGVLGPQVENQSWVSDSLCLRNGICFSRVSVTSTWSISSSHASFFFFSCSSFPGHPHGFITRVIPAVTALKYRDALTLAVGTSTGQVGVLSCTATPSPCPSHTPIDPSPPFVISSLSSFHSFFPHCPPCPLLLQVLLYDLRSSTPILIKDHYYSSPIHSIAFQMSNDLVLSADSKIMKIWHRNDVILLITVHGHGCMPCVCVLSS